MVLFVSFVIVSKRNSQCWKGLHIAIWEQIDKTTRNFIFQVYANWEEKTEQGIY